MNAEEMLDFALGQLDDAQRRAFEEAGRTDPEVAAKAHRVRFAVQQLVDDGYSYNPPPGLSRRTIALVAQTRRKGRSILDFVPVRVPFRWADFAVAASIFIAGLLTLTPAIQRSRERMNQAGCVFNLAQIGNSLAQYASIHPGWTTSSICSAAARPGSRPPAARSSSGTRLATASTYSRRRRALRSAPTANACWSPIITTIRSR